MGLCFSLQNVIEKMNEQDCMLSKLEKEISKPMETGNEIKKIQNKVIQIDHKLQELTEIQWIVQNKVKHLECMPEKLQEQQDILLRLEDKLKGLEKTNDWEQI